MTRRVYIPAADPIWTADRVGSMALATLFGGAALYAACRLVGLASLIGGV